MTTKLQTKRMSPKARANSAVQALAGLSVGSDAMVAEVSREVRPDDADEAALLFSRAVGMRMVSRWRYGRWWYGLTAEEIATLEAMATGVARRLGLPDGTSAAGVVRIYYAERVFRPREAKRAAKRARAT